MSVGGNFNRAPMHLTLTWKAHAFSDAVVEAPNVNSETSFVLYVERLRLSHHDLGHDHFQITERSQSRCRSAKLHSNGISCAEAD